MHKQYNYHNTNFMLSASNFIHLPPDNGIEIAFCGCSNVGKSSLLNTLTNQKKLARTSKIPGCTQFINLFEIEPNIRLVDLPGYGYAKASIKLRHKWQQHILGEYLRKRRSLKGLVVLMDIRHPMKIVDQQMIQWAVDSDIQVLVLLTKADKLAFRECKTQLYHVQNETIALITNNNVQKVQVEVFSSLKKYGLVTLQQKLDSWFNGIPYCGRRY